jgi:hypothetical protein
MRSTAVYMHPETHIWMVEQDRERAMAQRALERAAREGGDQRPGVARGGITSFARVLRETVGTIHIGTGSRGRTTRISGPSGA